MAVIPMQRCHVKPSSFWSGVAWILPAGALLAALPSNASGQCELPGLAASGASEGARLGSSIGISGDVIVVGAPREGADSASQFGAAYVFRQSGTTWVQEARLTAFDAEDDDYYGNSVAVSGDTVVVGADRDETVGSQVGSVYVYRWTGAAWALEDKLTASDETLRFGQSVALDGDRLVVGDLYDDEGGSSAGAAYVFQHSGATWVEEDKLIASDAADNDWFGRFVGISGSLIVVGATEDDDAGTGSGSAYVFRREGTSWVEEDKLIASDGAENDAFGRGVTIGGDRIVVGAILDDDDGDVSGSAYVFRREGTAWVEEAKLVASDAGSWWYFGSSVSISGDLLVVGSLGASAADDFCGAAYVFQRNGTTWTEIAKLAATDGVEEDAFGGAVGIDGNLVAVGAAYHNEVANVSGAAHVFAVAGDCNENGEPDLCDIAAGTSEDCDDNAIPDECDPDCDDDGTPDDCEPDTDSDGLVDDCDNCPTTPNADQDDADGDGFGDACDECPNDPNKIVPGLCGCGAPDSLDDRDGDTVIDCLDNCPDRANTNQADADGNGIGDVCEPGALMGPCGACGACGAGAGLTMAPVTILGTWLMKLRMRRRVRK